LNKFLFIVLLFFAFQIRMVGLTVDFKFNKVCLGDTTILISLATPQPNDSIVDWSWDLTGDGRFNDGKGDTIKYLFQTAGYQSVGLKVMTREGEVKAIYKLVGVGEVKADFIMGMGCTGQVVSFYDKSEVKGDTAFSWLWTFGDGTSTYDKNPTHIYSVAGDYFINFTLVTKNGCMDTTSQLLTIGQAPEMNLKFSGSTTFYEGDSVIVSTVEAFDSLLWSTGEKTESITIYTAGEFWVRGYLSGCYNEQQFTTSIKEFEKIPVIMNLFTPNGDGFNDLWEILNLSIVEPCEVKVYNRYGDTILNTDNYRNDWDGLWKGKQLPNDTYYYFVRCFDNVLNKGTVNILK